jgi:ribose 5-phosphate isomerase B
LDQLSVDAVQKSNSGYVYARIRIYRGERLQMGNSLAGEKQMPDLLTVLPKTPKRIGIAADHGGYCLKEQVARMLRESGHEVIDFGDARPNPEDDYPDFVVPLARAVASGEVERGVAICGSGVGASIVANKVAGVRACLIHETFSAHQGVEDDDLNMICLGGLVVGSALAWELVQTFLAAQFSGAERHRRRLAKVAELESRKEAQAIGSNTLAATPQQPETPPKTNLKEN